MAVSYTYDAAKPDDEAVEWSRLQACIDGVWVDLPVDAVRKAMGPEAEQQVNGALLAHVRGIAKQRGVAS